MKAKILTFLFLTALTFAAYSNSLTGEFVYDDKEFIQNNEYIKNLKNVPLFFTSKYTVSNSGHNLYRPLRTLSFALDYYFWREDVWGYHLANISLHASNGFLVYLLLRAALSMGAAAILPATFFILHPVQTETVAWISSRGDLLSVFFLLLGLLFYLGFLKKADLSGGMVKCNNPLSLKYCLMLIFFALSIFSKESAIIFPLLMILVEYYFRQDGERSGPFFARPNCFRLAKMLLPVIAIAALYVFARTAVLGEVGQRDLWGGSLYKTILTMTAVCLYYIRLLIFPVALRVVYRVNLIQSAADPRWLISAAALSLLIGASIYHFRKRNGFIFAASWFFIALLPVSNLIPIKGLMNEHFLYLPLFSLTFLLGLAIKELSGQIPVTSRQSIMLKWLGPGTTLRAAALPSISLMLLLFFILTNSRNKVWQTEFVWWQDIAKKSPDFIAHNNIGQNYSKKNLHHKALAQFKIAMLYLIKEERGELGGEGSAGNSGFMRPAISKHAPMFKAVIYYNLGNSYTELGIDRKAADEYQTAGLLDPELYQPRYNLGGVFYRSGQLDKSIAQFKEITPLMPDNYETYAFIGNSFYKKGQLLRAQNEYLKAYRINPFSADINKNLGLLLSKMGFADKAFFFFTQSLFLEPAQAELANTRKALAAAARERQGK